MYIKQHYSRRSSSSFSLFGIFDQQQEVNDQHPHIDITIPTVLTILLYKSSWLTPPLTRPSLPSREASWSKRHNSLPTKTFGSQH